MPRCLLAFAPLGLLLLACGSSTTSLTCPTKAQSISFTAAGSCSGAGMGEITISTDPGTCSLDVKGGAQVGLPNQGVFPGTAMMTNYDLTKGNWELQVDVGDTADGSTDILCEITDTSSSGVITLTCSGTICPPDDCGGTAQCSTVDCQEHLTPK